MGYGPFLNLWVMEYWRDTMFKRGTNLVDAKIYGLQLIRMPIDPPIWCHGYLPSCRRQLRQARSMLIGVACVQGSSSTLSSRELMSIRYYYLRSRLQKRDLFFGDLQQTYTRSASKADPYLANVLLEAERGYGVILAQNGVENLSILIPDITTPFGDTMQRDGCPSWWRWRRVTGGGSFPMGSLSGMIGWRVPEEIRLCFEQSIFLTLRIMLRLEYLGKGRLLVWLLLSRPFMPSCPVLGPAPNHPAVKMA
ncbi:hypothetical protein EDD18DRAFT_1109347 [Armillaria luteobubalina]|uniref:Uncharacterized protein n=1 Tax=Armillaria luteobubalina TaxID=153913 RepID=A0AA39TJN6_9AGAR|nr:hypothetical protein EDD18DRAFT_1109347 [Armillaria luteobubalina]